MDNVEQSKYRFFILRLEDFGISFKRRKLKFTGFLIVIKRYQDGDMWSSYAFDICPFEEKLRKGLPKSVTGAILDVMSELSILEPNEKYCGNYHVLEAV